MEPQNRERQCNRESISKPPGLPALTLRVPVNSVYHGVRHSDGRCEVRVHGHSSISATRNGETESRPLPFYLDVCNHSPTGFAWGYCGSGPAQLALAILVDATGDKELALRHYQDFKFQFVSGWGDSWRLTAEQVRSFISRNDQPAHQ